MAPLLSSVLPLCLLCMAEAASPSTRVRLENRYDFLVAEVEPRDYTKQGLCPKGIKLPECTACYERNTCSISMVGFEARASRSDTTVPYPATTATVSLAASFIGAPAFIVSMPATACSFGFVFSARTWSALSHTSHPTHTHAHTN